LNASRRDYRVIGNKGIRRNHRRRRPRRRLLLVDPPGGGELGKVSTALEQMVYAEATSVLPLLASDAYHRGH